MAFKRKEEKGGTLQTERLAREIVRADVRAAAATRARWWRSLCMAVDARGATTTAIGADASAIRGAGEWWGDLREQEVVACRDTAQPEPATGSTGHDFRRLMDRQLKEAPVAETG